MKKILATIPLGLLMCSSFVNADISDKYNNSAKVFAAQPSTCIKPTFSYTGNSYWWNVSLNLLNNCGQSVDLQNATVKFTSGSSLNTSFWGEFGSITYPTTGLSISSQPITGTSNYEATLNLVIPPSSGDWKTNSLLANGQSITIKFGAPFQTFSNANVTLGGTTPVQAGQIGLSNRSAQPTGVSQSFAIVDLLMNGSKIGAAQVPWSGQFSVLNLTPGVYTVSPQSVQDTSGGTYQGTASPASVTVTANGTSTSAVTYAKIASPGTIIIKTTAVPSGLAGYNGVPVVTLTRPDTGAAVTSTTAWNTSTSIKNLANNVSYTFSTPVITFNNTKCTGTFSPSSALSNATTAPTSTLSYTCSTVAQDTVNVGVSGLSASTNTVTVSFQPADGSAPVTKAVPLTQGAGSTTVSLTDGVVYSVSSTAISNYTASYNPQPLTAKPNVTETIKYSVQPVSAGGRVMAYLPGWKTPPSPASIAAAGYTHILVAFGVFSTTQPGVIVSAFDTVTQAYIAQLRQLGIKVVLSLGGASSSIANTTVDFHQALSAASSPTAFQNTFINSVQTLMTQYGFDGIDIDVEFGLNAGGTFTNPTGDIAVMANILNTLRANNPTMIISLVPQSPNVAPNSGFDATWGNYASLIMQTSKALTWVGVQVYNTGCVYGINQVCYADSPSSPDLSVAIGAGLLENWPSKTASGQATGFQPYISGLTPSQVVVGYPAVNNAGVADAGAIKSVAVIKRVIQCLRTGVKGTNSCDTYVPPRAYPGIGGVFEWEITYDQSNNFAFATGLKACVINGSC